MSEEPQTIVSDKVRRALLELGLTEYEVRAYLALVEHGPMTASELSETKLIPYSKIYEVLGSLVEKGFVETQQGRPAKYFPKSPAAAVESLVQSLERDLHQKSEIAIRELMLIFEEKGGRERPDIWILRGEKSVAEKIREAVSRCEKELLIAAPSFTKEFADILYGLILSVRAKDTKVQLMLSSSLPSNIINRFSQIAEVRVRGQMFGGGIICDNREVVIVFAEDKGPVLAIWSDHAGLAKFAKTYFEYLWKESKKFKRKP
ncbi:MAG: TrmB family transcriptional regulator [Candidatus Caldarchaeum sp.]|uniref:TrmB family transcriptional regulator n=1 Tax=Caldiarchaeum subterraneum TaxID=311458 RepID=A0A7C5U5V9_CALS0